jgi:hypothetical protein
MKDDILKFISIFKLHHIVYFLIIQQRFLEEKFIKDNYGLNKFLSRDILYMKIKSYIIYSIYPILYIQYIQ